MQRQSWVKSVNTIKKLCCGYLNNEFSQNDLSFLKGMIFDNIHCDDVVYYRAIRKLYPDKKITVRFHNVFSRIYERVNMLRIKTDWRFYGKMYLFRFLEREIMTDENVYKIFLTKEDATYYQLLTGNDDFHVWPMNVQVQKRNYKTIENIVWFGGIEGHKKASVDWFVNSVWPTIHDAFPDMEFHLYGRYSEKYNKQEKKIFGHGFYQGSDWLYVNNGLYINPDLMGGGIKLKVSSYLENGIRFISTPFGFEGYDNGLIDNKQCFVAPAQEWIPCIMKIKRNFETTR